MNTTLIVIFLGCVFFALVWNTALIWFVHKAFTNITTKVTRAVGEAEKNSQVREWLSTMERASQQAVQITESTKERFVLLEPALRDAHSRFGFLLAQIDIKVERLTTAASVNTARLCEAVTEPAHKFGTTASGVQSALGFLNSLNETD